MQNDVSLWFSFLSVLLLLLLGHVRCARCTCGKGGSFAPFFLPRGAGTHFSKNTLNYSTSTGLKVESLLDNLYSLQYHTHYCRLHKSAINKQCYSVSATGHLTHSCYKRFRRRISVIRVYALHPPCRSNLPKLSSRTMLRLSPNILGTCQDTVSSLPIFQHLCKLYRFRIRMGMLLLMLMVVVAVSFSRFVI